MTQSTIHKCPCTERARDAIEVEFLRKYVFPDIIGVVDGIHMSILEPKIKDHFINRKGLHSINAQIICDHNLNIINVFANWQVMIALFG